MNWTCWKREKLLGVDSELFKGGIGLYIECSPPLCPAETQKIERTRNHDAIVDELSTLMMLICQI
jgi:hypothetical protein